MFSTLMVIPKCTLLQLFIRDFPGIKRGKSHGTPIKLFYLYPV